MGYNSYTTQNLIDKVILKSHLPNAGQTFSSDDILSFANDELQLFLISQILSTRGGYYLTYQDYVNSADGLYDIPQDAIGGTLQNIQLVQNTVIVPVNIIEESEQFSTQSPNTTSYGAFLQGNFAQILPIPNVGNPRLWYLKRPSQLVEVSECGQITSFSTTSSTTIINMASMPGTFFVGTVVDVVGDQPPFNILGTANVTIASGNQITIDQVVDTITIGDWVALSEQTCVPAIPVEYRPVLEQRTICKMYEAQGYLDKLKAAKDVLKEMEMAISHIITPRIKTQTKIINPSNGGLMAGAKRGWGNYPAGHLGA